MMLVATHYESLTRPQLVAGIGMNSSIVLIGLAVAGMVILGLPFGLFFVVLSVVGFVTLSWAYRKDHKFVQVLKLYETLGDHYSGSVFATDTGLIARPKGYGKNLPC